MYIRHTTDLYICQTLFLNGDNLFFINLIITLSVNKTLTYKAQNKIVQSTTKNVLLLDEKRCGQNVCIAQTPTRAPHNKYIFRIFIAEILRKNMCVCTRVVLLNFCVKRAQ